MQQALRRVPVTSLKLPGGGGFPGSKSPKWRGGDGNNIFGRHLPPSLVSGLVFPQLGLAHLWPGLPGVEGTPLGGAAAACLSSTVQVTTQQ